MGASDLMACMAFESGETFSPSIRNAAGSGATGLIQFMPSTARGLGTTVEDLATMRPEEQIEWVFKYFDQFGSGKVKNLGDMYMAILWPSAIGKPDSFILWNKMASPTTYAQNAGLDANKDGVITRGEALAKISAKLVRGNLPQYLWTGGAS